MQHGSLLEEWRCSHFVQTHFLGSTNPACLHNPTPVCLSAGVVTSRLPEPSSWFFLFKLLCRVLSHGTWYPALISGFQTALMRTPTGFWYALDQYEKFFCCLQYFIFFLILVFCNLVIEIFVHQLVSDPHEQLLLKASSREILSF